MTLGVLKKKKKRKKKGERERRFLKRRGFIFEDLKKRAFSFHCTSRGKAEIENFLVHPILNGAVSILVIALPNRSSGIEREETGLSGLKESFQEGGAALLCSVFS